LRPSNKGDFTPEAVISLTSLSVMSVLRRCGFATAGAPAGRIIVFVELYT
jgi:hypothetical protein